MAETPTKADIVQKIALQSGLTQRTNAAPVYYTIYAAIGAIRAGENSTISGSGNFCTRGTAEP